MDPEHYKNLKNDFNEVKNLYTKSAIDIKLAYYCMQRPIASFFLSRILKERLANDKFFMQTDRFLLGDGGMFKTYVYKIHNRFKSLRDSHILVPGIGYGKNLFQLACFRPKMIVAFDLYEYPAEWQYLEKKIYQEFKVKVCFRKCDIHSLPQRYSDLFDSLICDAVLEHMDNLPEFIVASKQFLKKGAIFYSSLGPIWYGPYGDHIDGGKNRFFDHLILSREQYQKNFDQRFSYIKEDSTEAVFIVKNNLFSYFSTQEYLKCLQEAGFRKLLCFAKISTPAISLLSQNREICTLLDERKVPDFDRYCSGLYIWLKLETI